jgi:hypothetical protein
LENLDVLACEEMRIHGATAESEHRVWGAQSPDMDAIPELMRNARIVSGKRDRENPGTC